MEHSWFRFTFGKFATDLRCIVQLLDVYLVRSWSIDQDCHQMLQGVFCKWWCMVGQVDWLSTNGLISINKLACQELNTAVYMGVPTAMYVLLYVHTG